MALESKRISVSELDFDQIKSNLKDFMRGQSQFTDYDFEGSALSNLLDVLALNTHYNALYTNLAVNEMFLDSAVKRNSVVSLAKMLGYVPNSAKCASATVNVTVNNPVSTPTTLTLPRYSTFSTSIDGVGFTFYTTENVTISSDGTSYVFNNVSIREGTPLSFKYTAASGQRYIIPNKNVDLSTLNVRVQENASSSKFVTFSEATSLVDITPTDNVYFIKEIDDQLYELTFGDDIIGTALSNGNVVNIEYFVSSLSAPNGCKLFTYTGPTLIGGVVTVTTTASASGGSDVETIDSIKFNAPRFYAAQDRAVTPDDYKAIIYKYVPEAQSVAVWGGEDNIPPVYGKVFVCIKPQDTTILTTQQKDYILSSILNKKSVVSVIPELVDPEYLNLSLDVTFYYNQKETTRTAKELETLVSATVNNYNSSDLQKFDSIYRHSKLLRLIDMTEPSILNSNVTFRVHREIAPKYNINAEYTVNLVNPIYSEGVPEEAVSSNGFYITGSTYVHYLRDDGVGNIVLYYRNESNQEIVVNSTIGTVDYNAGKVDIKNLNISSLAADNFELIFKTQSYDVVSANNQIVQVYAKHLTVTAISDQTVNGNVGAGSSYQFTSSRN